MPWTYQILVGAGNRDLAEQLAHVRGEPLLEPAPLPQPTVETLAQLLAQPDWQNGRIFLHVDHFVEQLDELDDAQRWQLQEFVTNELYALDFSQAFTRIDDGKWKVWPKALAYLIYGRELKIPVTTDLYRKLLNIHFDDSVITTLCLQNYLPERAAEIISWVREDAPVECLSRAVDLCTTLKLQPRGVVPKLGEVIIGLCSQEKDHDLFLTHLAQRLLRALSNYGVVGANKLQSLISKVHPSWAMDVVRLRLSLRPASPIAEAAYLRNLISEIKDNHSYAVWGFNLLQVETLQSVPLLLELLRNLLLTTSGGEPLRSQALATLTRLASGEVIEGFRGIMSEFPNEAWLGRYYADIKRVYLARLGKQAT